MASLMLHLQSLLPRPPIVFGDFDGNSNDLQSRLGDLYGSGAVDAPQIADPNFTFIAIKDLQDRVEALEEDDSLQKLKNAIDAVEKMVEDHVLEIDDRLEQHYDQHKKNHMNLRADLKNYNRETNQLVDDQIGDVNKLNYDYTKLSHDVEHVTDAFAAFNKDLEKHSKHIDDMDIRVHNLELLLERVGTVHYKT